MTRGPLATRLATAVDRRHGKLEGAWRDCVIAERLLAGG